VADSPFVRSSRKTSCARGRWRLIGWARIPWAEEREGGCDGVHAHLVLSGGGHLRPAGEEAEAHRATVTGPDLIEKGIDDVLAVVGNVDEVLCEGPVRPGQGEDTIVHPLLGGEEEALSCKGTGGRREESGVMNLAVAAMRGKGARATRRERSEEKFRDAPTLE
jgi:hypothetical protein